MNATISLNSLWAAIQSLSPRNKRWLADRLIEDLQQPKQESEEQILSAIARGMKDVKDGHTYPIDDLWDQLK